MVGIYHVRRIVALVSCASAVLAGSTRINAQCVLDSSASIEQPHAQAHAFGSAISWFGDHLAVAAPEEMPIGSQYPVGAVYLYRHVAEQWILTAALSAPPGTLDIRFGSSVHLRDERIIVGGSYRAYIFRRQGSSWLHEATFPNALTAGPSGPFNAAGLEDDVAVIASSTADETGIASGAVHVFRRCAGWLYAQRLTGNDTRANDRFGTALVLEDDTLVVGAPMNECWNESGDPVLSNAGAVYVFHESGDGFIQSQKVTAATAVTGAQFGASVFLHGDTLLVGAPHHPNPHPRPSGAVYRFQRSDGGWNQTGILQAPEQANVSEFGRSVEFDGSRLIVGALGGVLALDWPVGGEAFVRLGQADPGSFGSLYVPFVQGERVVVGTATLNRVAEFDLGLLNQDCNNNGTPDRFDIVSGASNDCQYNCFPDECDIALGFSEDCNGNGLVDGCEPDCNATGVPDDCDIPLGLSEDCNENLLVDACEPDCNANGRPDDCDTMLGFSQDCNLDLLPDECSPPSAMIESRTGDTDFAFNVATDGHRILASSPSDDECESLGAAYVYCKQGDSWQQEAALRVPNPPSGSLLGRGVAIHGNNALVGDYGLDAVHVFTRSAGTWEWTQTLQREPLFATGWFGATVAMEGDTAIVGDPYDSEGLLWPAGSVTIFRRTSGGWMLEAIFRPPAPAYGGYGAQLAISGNRFIVGNNDGFRKAYVVARIAGEWMQEAELSIPEVAPSLQVAHSVALHGDFAAIGAPRFPANDVSRSGRVDVFQFNGEGWQHHTTLISPEPIESEHFGMSVSLSDELLLVRGLKVNGQTPSRMYAYELVDGTWNLTRTQLTTESPIVLWAHPHTLTALHGTTCVTGAPSWPRGGTVQVYDNLAPRCGCPTGDVTFVAPPSGSIDARQPYPPEDPASHQGFEQFTIAAPAGAWGRCWTVSDSGTAGGSSNQIKEVLDHHDGTYTITLMQPLAVGTSATIAYTAVDGSTQSAGFTSHPGNVNGDSATSALDLHALIDALNGTWIAPFGLASLDIDRSGEAGPSDVLRLLEILNGTNGYEHWLGTSLPEPLGCP